MTLTRLLFAITLLAVLVLDIPTAAQLVVVPGAPGLLPGGGLLSNGASAPPAPSQGHTWWFNPTLNTILGYDGTGWQSDTALITKDVIVTDARWGAKGDGSTDDTTAIQAAATYLFNLQTTAGNQTLGGGGCLVFPAGVYVVSTPISVTIPTGGQNTANLCIRGAGMYGSVLLWKGGNNHGVLEVSITDATGVNWLSISGLMFYNLETSGSGVTAVRARQIDGIRLLYPNSTSGGINEASVDGIYCLYTDNCISVPQGPITQLWVTRSQGTTYNQISPVANPNTDALVDGHGNFVYIAPGSGPHGEITLEKNSVSPQAFMLDAGAAGATVRLINTSIRQNLQLSSAFQNSKFIRVGEFDVIEVLANEAHFPSGGVAQNLFALGTKASTGLSSGLVSNNICLGSSSMGQNCFVLTYGDGVVFASNTCTTIGGSCFTVDDTNSKNTVFLPNTYNSVTTKLTNTGANTTILDPQLGYRFASGLGIGVAASANNLLNLKGDHVVLNHTATTATTYAYAVLANGTGALYSGVESSVGGTVFAGTTAYDGFIGAGTGQGLDLVGNGTVAGRVYSGMVLGTPTGGDKGAGTVNIATTDGYLVNNTALKNITETLSNKTLASPIIGSGGTAITLTKVYAPSLTPAQLAAAIGVTEQTFTVTGLTTADKVIVNGPAPTALCPPVTYRVSAADTLAIGFVDLTAALCTPAAGTYNIVAIRS